MSEQLWKYLPHIPQAVKKPGTLKRRSEVTDKEVLNLTGGLFPLKIIDAANKGPSYQSQKVDHYVYKPILQKNNKIGPIYHWVKEEEANKLYHGEKFNVEPQIPSFSEQEYRQLDLKWPYSTVQDIFDLMGRFNMNFILVEDRMQNHDLGVEDIKEVYFTVCRRIYQKRDEKENPLASYVFDKKYESNRKYELEKYMMRNKVDTDREKYLINEIKRLEILIKKEQREQINLKKALKLDEVPEEKFQLGSSQAQSVDIYKSRKVYTRQQYLMSPLKLPGKVAERLNQVLIGMNIPDKIMASEENTQLYDKLRQKILLMFSIQRYIKKKEIEKKILEEKKKRISAQEEDDKKNPIKAVDSLKKKIHTNSAR